MSSSKNQVELSSSKIDIETPSNIMDGLDTETANRLLEQYGRNEIPEKVTPPWKVFLLQFTGTMPFMIEVACILALVVQRWEDFAIILAMLLVNAMIGYHEQMKARKSVDALKGSLEHKVSTKRDGQFTLIEAALLVPGDVIFIRGGHIVPADSEYLEGDILQVDTAALTGETFPVKVPRQDSPSDPGSGRRLLSGFIIKSGEGYAVVRKTGLNTEIGQAALSIQQNSAPARGLFESKILFVVKLVIIITLVLTVIVLLVQIVGRKHAVIQVLVESLSLVIASVPIALPVVIQVTMAIGAKKMSEHKAIITHMTALQEIASMTVLCSDKTGTLTTAKITIYHDQIWSSSEQFSQDDILTWATIASNANNKDDPIDISVINSFNTKFGPEAEGIRAKYQVEKFIGFTPITKRTVAYVNHRSSTRMRISKGLVNKVLETGDDGGDTWVCDKADQFREILEKKDAMFASRGFKTIGVAVSFNDGPMIFAGIIPMQDPPRADTKDTIRNIKQAKIRVKMITGDHLNIAKETARQIELGTNILLTSSLYPPSSERDDLVFSADGFAQVLPKDKQEVVSILQNRGLVVGMTGDGVNDAPALAKAQIGIAVEGATDAAKSAADILLTEPGLSPIYEAVLESRRIFKRLRSYVLYRLAATVQIVLVLSVLIFQYDNQLDAIYVILLALFNDVSMMPVAYDYAVPSKTPEKPTIQGLLVVSVILGVLEAIQSIGLYQLGDKFLSSNFSDSHYRQVAIYLQITLAIEFLIISCRTPGFFFLSIPCKALIASVLTANTISTLATGFGIVVGKLHWMDILYIWIYDVVWLFVIDILKICAFIFLSDNEDGAKLSSWIKELTTLEHKDRDPMPHSHVDLEHPYVSFGIDTSFAPQSQLHKTDKFSHSFQNSLQFSAARASFINERVGSILPTPLTNPEIL